MTTRRFVIVAAVAGTMLSAWTAAAAPPKSVRVPAPEDSASAITLVGATPWVSTSQRGSDRASLWKVPTSATVRVKRDVVRCMAGVNGSLWTINDSVVQQRNAAGKVIWSGRLATADGSSVQCIDGLVAAGGALYVGDDYSLLRIDAKTRQVTQVGSGGMSQPAVRADGTAWGVQGHEAPYSAVVVRPDGTTGTFPLPADGSSPAGTGAVAGDGSYWLEWGRSLLRVGPDGVTTVIDGSGRGYLTVVAAPDGSIWTGRRDGRVLSFAAGGGPGKVRGKAPSGSVVGLAINGRKVWVLHREVTSTGGGVVKPAGVFKITR